MEDTNKVVHETIVKMTGVLATAALEQVSTEAKPIEPLSLITEMTQILKEVGHPQPEQWETYIPSEALKIQDEGFQRFFLNRAIRTIFSEASDEQLPATQNARFALLDGQCLHEDYVRLFKEGVAPCLTKLKLPIDKS